MCVSAWLFCAASLGAQSSPAGEAPASAQTAADAGAAANAGDAQAAGSAQGAPQGDELALFEERFGFRIVRPGAQWISYAAEAGADNASYTLTLYERDTPYLPSVVVYVADHDGKTSAEEVRASAAATLVQHGEQVLEQSDTTLAGRPAALLRCRAKRADGQGEYVAELRYLVVPPFVYAVQCSWAAEGPRPDAVLDAIVASFELSAPKLPVRDEAAEQLAALAARCGSELPWATDWAAASARARAEGKPVCVVFEHYTVLEIPHTIDSGALMDTDLVALLAERFVPLRLGVDDPAPFRAADARGMGSHSWGGSILFVSAEGEVLEELGVPHAFPVIDAARRVLARGGPAVPAPREATPRDAKARLEFAARQLRRGELQAARVTLDHPDTPAGHALRVMLLALQRRGDEALAELAIARRGADAALLADLTVEGGVLQMRMGRFADAHQSLQGAVAATPDGRRAPEALFWLGALEMLQQGDPQGRERWRTLVAKHPENRWAWKAAANLAGQGSFVNGGERLDWPDAATFHAIERPPVARLPLGQLERARRDAIAYLLSAQRPDGSWLAPMDALGAQPGGYTFAITGLCGSSLLPFAEKNDVVRDAVHRAEEYLVSVHAAGGLRAGETLAGVYSIWGRLYTLRFLAQCRHAHIGGDERLTDALDDLLQSVLGSQHAGGGWPYISLASSTSTTGFDPSTSFLTAGVLLALLDVRAAGIGVPQLPLDRGQVFLSRLRHADGSFRYMRDAPEPEDNPEAAGRGPVCALALLRGGSGTLDELSTSLQRFDAQRAALKREWGKDTCHTGPEGQGAHYLLFDWAFAAQAVAQLPRHHQQSFRRALLQDILDVRDAEGAYADMPALGRAYGTAMALAAFQSLGDDR